MKKLTKCAPSEDSDQPGHPPSLIRVFAVRLKKAWVLRYPLSIYGGDSDQTGRLPRLIRGFAGCICEFVGFVVCVGVPFGHRAETLIRLGDCLG